MRLGERRNSGSQNCGTQGNSQFHTGTIPDLSKGIKDFRDMAVNQVEEDLRSAEFVPRVSA
jgi:hypothetical protein